MHIPIDVTSELTVHAVGRFLDNNLTPIKDFHVDTYSRMEDTNHDFELEIIGDVELWGALSYTAGSTLVVIVGTLAGGFNALEANAYLFG